MFLKAWKLEGKQEGVHLNLEGSVAADHLN